MLTFVASIDNSLEKGSPLQMAILGSRWDADTSRHERSESGMTSQTLVSSSSGELPGAQNRSRLTQAGLREASEMLGLGTQELRPSGLKHQATDNDVLYQSLFSKPIRVLGAGGEVTISSLSIWRQLFLSQTSRQTGRALRDAAKIIQNSAV